MLPKELDNIFEAYDEDDYQLHVTKARFSGNNFLIEFNIDVEDLNDKGPITQTWRVEATGHREIHVSFDLSGLIEIADDHPLL